MHSSILKRVLTAFLAVCLVVGTFAPITAYAEEPETTDVPEAIAAITEEIVGAEAVIESEVASVEPLSESEELSVETYAEFLAALKVLEGYADTYAAANGKDAKLLVLNYIRTGVKKYTSDSWVTVAGAEETEFVNYVAAQDAAKGTVASGLRNVSKFYTPNGQLVEFDHMFGTMNISWKNASNADMGGWAGDLSDLLAETKGFGVGEIADFDAMVKEVKEVYLGVDLDDISGFGILDIYGDLDAYYLINQMRAGGALSDIMKAYFTGSLTDNDRAVYFLNTRFRGVLTNEDVRDAIYNTYKADVMCQILDADNGITSADANLKKACCYAFADYLFELADGRLLGPEEEPDEPEVPEEPDVPGEPEEPVENPYYTVFSSTTSNLAPGITQTITYANTADDKQIVYYLATVDVTREDVTIKAGYHNADPGEGWAMQRVSEQAEAMMKKHSNPEDAENYIENFQVVVATNGAGFNMGTGEPGGLLVMDGKEWHPVNSDGFFAILKDGSAKIGTTAEYAAYKDRIQEAISGFGHVLIKNGEFVATSDGGRASRTAIGIKADGSVVMMVMDGRQEPFSAGGSMKEIAQVMLEAGCVEAINLDGGGSTTFVAKPEGGDSLEVINRPSDGYQRSVSTSLLAVSTAVTSNEFAYATIRSEYDYLTVGTGMELSAVGVSLSGNAAEIPEDATWAVSNNTIGTIADGVFTATALGDVEVRLMVGEEVVGSKMLHVVIPDKLFMEQTSMNVIYDVPAQMPLKASYNDNLVKFNDNDIITMLQFSNAGSTDGLTFIVEEGSGYRTLLAGAALVTDMSVRAMLTLNCYRADEAIFDFDNATSGNEKFAWSRKVTNSIAQDGQVYQILDTEEDMEVSYIFALDMQAIEVPEKLKDLTGRLPGEGSRTAWEYLLDLAERVSTLTTVNIEVKFDMDFDLDCSELTISNDLFEQESITVDHDTNTVVVKARWIDQTQSVDSDSVSSVCVLSGIKMTPKDDAAWDSKNQLAIANVGEVTYDIYLRASSLYSFALDEANQELFDLHPFINPDNPEEKGASFSSTYTTFADNFILDSTNRNGWYTYDDQLFYYVDNVAVTGIHRLPGYEDPSVELFYSFDENGAFNKLVTGMITVDGKFYYAINGEAKTGWRTISEVGGEVNYYYFDPNLKGAAVDGIQTIAGYTYTFQDYKLIRGHLATDAIGTRYRWAGQWVTEEWLVIDGREAYAQRGGYFMEGLWKRYYKDNQVYYFAFGEDGFWMKEYSGLYDYNGATYLIEKGLVVEYAGLVKVGDDYYYFCSKDTMVKGCDYWFSKTNGIVPNGRYTIAADGKVQLPVTPGTPDAPENPPVTPDPDVPVLNGIVKESDEVWYYYVNGVKTYAGLILIDGDYYYVNSHCQVIHGCDYWISKNNGYMPNQMYTFDAEGKMVLETEPDVPGVPGTPAEPEEKLNGIVKESDEVWYYYVDGVKTYAGLILIDGDYYYVNSKCQVIHGCEYWISKNNGYMPNKMYTFDAEGKMVLETKPDVPVEPEEPEVPEEKLNGIVKESDEVWYYYVDGVKTYAGLIKIGDDYYYVDSKCMVKHDCTYWISKNNGYISNGSYTFDAEGKMVLDGTPLAPKPENPDTPAEPEAPVEKLNGIVKDGDNWYYYVDGVKTYAGLFILDGYYYYADSKGMVKHDCTYWISKNNGYLKNQQYTFDSEGRIVGYYPEAN